MNARAWGEESGMNLIDTRDNDIVGSETSPTTGLKRVQTINDLSASQIAAIR